MRKSERNRLKYGRHRLSCVHPVNVTIPLGRTYKLAGPICRKKWYGRIAFFPDWTYWGAARMMSWNWRHWLIVLVTYFHIVLVASGRLSDYLIEQFGIPEKHGLLLQFTTSIVLLIPIYWAATRISKRNKDNKS